MALTPLQRLAYILRNMHLLSLADFFWFIRSYLLNLNKNLAFKRMHPDIPIPPPLVLYDIQANCNLSGYHASGQQHAVELSQLISSAFPDTTIRILEWGCGPARVIQHLQSPTGSCWELWGSDYNPQAIAWCTRHFDAIRFIDHQLAPPLPVESDFFDVVYCISVFTHLSEERHHQWVDEIIRGLKPGGLFIGTFHGDAFRENLTTAEQAMFDRGELVVRDKIKEGKKDFSAYHSDPCVKRILAKFDHVQKIETCESFRQTVWTANKHALTQHA